VQIDKGDVMPQIRGRQHPDAKLTERAVIRARDRVRRGVETVRSLARHYGVSAPTMWMAVRGITWTHVPGAVKRKR
jgi:hypothetical protein